MSSVDFVWRSADSSARLVAMVVVPTPPLGLNTVMTRRALGSPIDAVASGTTGAAPVRPLEPQRHGLDPRLELDRVERLA